jgi:formylglycine-generating enzyme required for sulfatase activity
MRYRQSPPGGEATGFRLALSRSELVPPKTVMATAASEAPAPVSEERVADTKAPPPVVPPGIETLTNSVGMRFNLCRSGALIMGDAYGSRYAKPPHTVKITKPFYIGVYEVTNAEWKRVMGTTTTRSNWKEDDRPVETVVWEEAATFCQRLSSLRDERQAGRVYRLPTEAEWEYACRAGTTTRWSFGDDASLSEHGWFADNSGRQTHTVGLKKPNAWGLYDIHGNVSEFVSDFYDAYYYAKSPDADPQGPNMESRRAKVVRGGNYNVAAGSCCSAARNANDSYSDTVGFRLVLSSPESSAPEAAAK